MPLIHKFQDINFGNGYQAHNSILDVTPYEPEVIFIGTYNHGWGWNKADFFYGRGMYMWPVLANLLLHGRNELIKQRTEKNNVPTFDDVFNICKKGKIVFADIVKGIREQIPVSYPRKNCVLVNNTYEWCSRKIKSQKVGKYSDTHLNNMGAEGWLDDNVEAIVKYLNSTPSIKNVYFTFKSGSWLVKKLESIKDQTRPDLACCSIFTPTVNGFGNNLPFPFDERAFSLAHCWIWNGIKDHRPNIDRLGYGRFSHEWLVSCGVKNLDDF